MSPISQGPRFDFRLLILTINIALIASVSSTAAGDGGIDLPVEFFFGRWEAGGTVGVFSAFEKETLPHWSGYGEFTAPQFQLGARAWTGSPYPNARDYTGEGFAAGAQVRPRSTLQLGVDRLLHDDQEAFLPRGHYRHDETFDVASSLRYSTADTIRVPRVFEQFVYAGGRALGSGQLLGRAYGSYDRYLFDGTPSFPFSARPMMLEGRETTTSLGTEIMYGLSERLTVDAGVFSESYRSYEHSIVYPQTAVEDTITYRFDRDRLGVSLGVAAALNNALLARVAFIQQYAEAYLQDDIYYTFDPDSTLDVMYYVRDQGRKRERTFVKADLIYQVRGSFDNQIILDDYLDYYRHFLFDGQKRASLSFEYAHAPDNMLPSESHGRLAIDYSQGMPGNTEISANVTYSWEQDRLSYYAYGTFLADEEINWSLGLRWRSFDYLPGRGPGWDRDSRADFVFGPLLPPGGVYLNLTLIPPGWTQTGGSYSDGFLSFSRLEVSRLLAFSGESVVGVGGHSEIGSDILFRVSGYGSGNAYSGDVSAFVRSRIDGRFEIRVAYEQSFRKPYHDPAQVTLNLAGIF